MSEAVMRRLAKPLLFLAAFIWGTSFFIMKNTLDAVPPFWLLVFRFTTGAVLLGLFCWKKWRTHFTRDYLWRGGLFGVFLFIAYTTQTFGLTGTTPSKNAFLTATYCVLVPFLAWRVFHRRPDQYNLLAAFLCITGVGLVSLSGDLTVTWGDGLSLFSALFYALHIVAVNRLSGGKDIYLLTTVQFASTALLSLAGGLLFQPVRHGHHRSPPVPERGPGVVGALLRLGDSLPGVGIWGAVLSTLLRRPGESPAAGGIWPDLHCSAVLGDEIFLSAEEELGFCLMEEFRRYGGELLSGCSERSQRGTKG